MNKKILVLFLAILGMTLRDMSLVNSCPIMAQEINTLKVSVWQNGRDYNIMHADTIRLDKGEEDMLDLLDPNKGILLNYSDNTTIGFPFSSEPLIVLHQSDFEVIDLEEHYVYPYDQLRSISFGVIIPTSISKIDDTDKISFTINNRHVTVKGLTPKDEFYIFDITGKMVCTLTALNKNDELHTELPKGINTYIAKTSTGKSFKFILKQ